MNAHSAGHDCPSQPEALQQARTNKINQRTRAMHGCGKSICLIVLFEMLQVSG